MPLSSIASAIASSVLSAILDAPSVPQQPVVPAIIRPFPEGTKFGKLAGPPQQMMTITINEKEMQAAPGLQIRNEMNMIVIPTMVGTNVPIRYQLDPMGAVWRVWLLSPAEVAALNYR